MDFVDIDRRVLPIPAAAPLQPGSVVPNVTGGRHDVGGRPRSQLDTASVGVGFDQHVAGVAIGDLKTVEAVGRRFGHQ